MNLLPDGLLLNSRLQTYQTLEKVSRSTAQQMAYCFRKAGTIDEIGKTKEGKIRKRNLILKNDTSICVNNMIKILVTYASPSPLHVHFQYRKKQLMTWRQLCNTKRLVCIHELHPPNRIQCHALKDQSTIALYTTPS